MKNDKGLIDTELSMTKGDTERERWERGKTMKESMQKRSGEIGRGRRTMERKRNLERGRYGKKCMKKIKMMGQKKKDAEVRKRREHERKELGS